MSVSPINYVIKRNGEKVPIDLNEVLRRITECSTGLKVDALSIAARTVGHIRNDVHTSELDAVSVRLAEHNGVTHPDYLILAARIHISNFMKLQKNMYRLLKKKVKCMKKQNRVGIYATLLMNHKHINGEVIPVLSDDVYKFMSENQVELKKMLKFERNYNLSYRAYKLLEDKYLLKSNGFSDLINTTKTPDDTVSKSEDQSNDTKISDGSTNTTDKSEDQPPIDEISDNLGFDDRIIECAQLLYMRVAVGISCTRTIE